jgi:tetratricopeptide (TPR) repeat protein
LRLQVARDLHVAGRLEEALNHYERLVNAGKLLPEVVQHLPTLADATRDRYRAWQILGDAYMKTDRLNDALEAYKEARRALTL